MNIVRRLVTFATIEDLKDVKGVGGKIFNKIKDLIIAE